MKASEIMNSTGTQLLPEEIVVAVLNKVGCDVRLADDLRLASVFDDVAQDHGGIFKQFVKHPRYHYSRLLTATLQSLSHGGSIVRDSQTSYFRVTRHTAGAYGKRIFDGLSHPDQVQVKALAKRIVSVFEEDKE